MYRSDPQLIRACQRGDAGAWDDLIELYGRLVYSIPRRYGMAEDDAEDVAQTVFAVLHEKFDQLRDETRLSAWLITTTHRECWRVCKRKRAEGELDESVPAEEPDASTIDIWDRQNTVRLALHQLGGRCEDLLRLLYMTSNRPSYEAIAAELGISVGSIGPTRARCLAKLQHVLVDLGFQSDIDLLEECG